MSGTRAYPEVSVLISNGSTLPFQASAPLIVNDIMSGTLIPGGGDGSGLGNSLNPNLSNEWYKQPAYSSVTKLRFYRFAQDSTVQFGSSPITSSGVNDWAGWALEPRVAYLDSKIGSNADEYDSELVDINWDEILGEWETAGRSSKKTGTGIYLSKQGSGNKSQARTRGTIVANRSMLFYASFMGQGDEEDVPDARLQWGAFDGGLYSLIWRDREAIGLDKAVNEVVTTNGSSSTVETTWNRVKTFDSLPPANMTGGSYQCQILRVSGRLVVIINGQAFWHIEREAKTESPFQNTTTEEVEPVDVRWGEGKVQLEVNNATARLEMGVVKYSSAEGELNTGAFEKIIKRLKPLDSVEGVTTGSGGWKKEGTSIKVDCGAGGTSYSCELEANEDGIDTPFVTKCFLRGGAIYTAPVRSTIDFKGAARNIKVSSYLPQQDNSQGASFSIEFDALAARRIAGDFLDYITPYRQVKIAVRWLDEFGNPQTNFVPLFQGSSTFIRDGIASHSSHIRTLGGRDATVLLQQPAHGIDHRYGPLDFDLITKSNGALSNVNQSPNLAGTRFYDYDAARAILSVELPQLAEQMEVHVPPSHIPLIDATKDRCGYFDVLTAFTGSSPYQNGFIFPAKYKSYLYDWLRDFMVLGHSSLFVGPPENDRYGWPVLKWVRLAHWLLLSGRMTHRAPDNVYLEGDEAKAFAMLEVETKPDMDYNHFFASSSPPDTDLGGLLPDLRMSEDYLRTGPSVAWRSWRRTYFLENPLAWVGGAGVAGVDSLAQRTRLELEGSQPLWPSVTLPGNAMIQPGDKLNIVRSVAGNITGSAAVKDYSSPAGLDGMVNTTARITGVEHSIDLATVGLAHRFTTTPQLRPLLASGI